MMVIAARIRTALLSFAYHNYVVGAPTKFQQGNLAISNLFVYDPFQTDPTSSYNSTLSLIVTDPDYPELKPVHCQIQWEAGLSPPSASSYHCENVTTRAWFPERTFNGVQNFQLQFAHTVTDTSIGDCPEYCYLTKYAMVNLTYPGTSDWGCDVKSATCEQVLNTTISAPIYLAVA